MRVFTLGYGGRRKGEALALLLAHGIKTLVDIRLRPDRASMGIWVKARSADKGIEGWLTSAGIGYRSLIELGNVFRDLPDWRSHYQRLLAAAGPVLTERLHEVPGPYCLLCAEKQVSQCHRLEVANYLASHHGAEVMHLE